MVLAAVNLFALLDGYCNFKALQSSCQRATPISLGHREDPILMIASVSSAIQR
jgi:hypothetical protein